MKVFCWDFDGTLTVPDPRWRDIIIDSLGLDLAGDDGLLQKIRACMYPEYPWNTPDEDHAAYRGEAAWKYLEDHFYRGLVECGIPPGAARAAAGTVRPAIKRAERYRLYDDAVDTLRYVKEHGAVNVLLTNNYPDLYDIIDALGLTEYFDEMIISGVVGFNKPRREIFELAKAKYPGAEFYMIGDSVNADILGGKQCGMRTVLVHRGHSEHADCCFDDLQSIRTLL